jgi:hypothetical protein
MEQIPNMLVMFSGEPHAIIRDLIDRAASNYLSRYLYGARTVGVAVFDGIAKKITETHLQMSRIAPARRQMGDFYHAACIL